jgi:hypothetical protein
MSLHARPWRRREFTTAICAVALLAAAAALVHAWFMLHPEKWPLTAFAGWIRQLSGEYRRGIVVFDRPATFTAPPNSYLDFALLTARKWAFYFTPWLADYSGSHKVLNLVFFVPTYLLGAAAVATYRDRRAKFLLLLFLIAFSAFHAMQQIDFDHRYRLPVLPALIILAGAGVPSRRQTIGTTAPAVMS